MQLKRYKYVFFIAVMALVLQSFSPMYIYADNAESEVNVEFLEGDEVIPPLDPEDPNQPLGPPGTGSSGPLTLNYVSPLTFGQQRISYSLPEYNSSTPRPFIQVSDLRGTGSGWRVEAMATEFTNTDLEPSLLGATITLTNATVISPLADMTAPTAVDTVELPTDGVTILPVVLADPESGLGTWLTRWYTDPAAVENTSVTLTVPPSSVSTGQHIGNINWILVDAP